MNEDSQTQAPRFSELGISAKILEMLTKRGFTTPTPIQHQAIPVAVKGKDVIGIAQTGTGKTLAFGIPMLQQLAEGKGRALIVLPTRELAYQVEEAIAPFTKPLGINTAVFVGGASMGLQRGMLKRNPRILIGTPGRINDHLERKTITLREVTVLVLDEADRMLDMGFKPQIDRILAHVPKQRQTMLFSATMPQAIVKLATSEMQLPLRIEVVPPGTTATNVEQELFVIKREDKIGMLRSILDEYKGTVLVFSRTKHGAKKMTKSLRDAGITAAEIHANRSLGQRREALEGFKRGKYRVLVATDIAARGIDVTNIEVVVNYDLPDDAADYVHRIGRTGRAGREGKAISFATPDQAKHIREIEKLIRAPLKMSKHETVETVALSGNAPSRRGPPRRFKGKSPQQRRSGGGGSRFGGRGRRR